MKFKVTYYRTLIYEGEIEADTLDDAKEIAEEEVSSMKNADFQEIHEEEAEIECEESIPVTVVVI